jgi:transposase
MSRYVTYNPDQEWLLPPSVRSELGESHLAVFLHRFIERLNLGKFEAESSEHGRPGYPPQMLLKVWLYAYALGVTSSRRLEQRIREDLGFRLLAGNLKPDFWVLNEFRKKHPKALNNVFTQVVEGARKLGMGKLGRVAIDSTRIAANASPDRSDNREQLRHERARIRQRIRRWQKQCDQDDDSSAGGNTNGNAAEWLQRLEEIPVQLEQLRKSGQKRSSQSDPESRHLRKRGGFCLGYAGEVAVTDDHLIVAQRVHQEPTDNGSLAAMTEEVERECGAPPETVVADSGYDSMPEIQAVEERGIAVYVPDALVARELAGGSVVGEMNARQKRRHPGLQALRDRMREPAARQCYARRKAIVEPVFGVLKQQRGMRQFRRRGLEAVGTEWALATTAYNLTRMFRIAGENGAD